MSLERFFTSVSETIKRLPTPIVKATLSEYIEDKFTPVQVKSILETRIGIAFTLNQNNDIQILLDGIDAIDNLPISVLTDDESAEISKGRKIAVLEVFISVLVLAEAGLAYQTDTLLRARLGWSEIL